MSIAENFHPQSKVWMYQSNRPFTPEEIKNINAELKLFAQKWTAHNLQLKAMAQVLEDRFILLMVDETQTGASGCSIDTSVNFMKALGEKYGVDFFNRMLFSYLNQNGIETKPLSEIPSLKERKILADDTPVFNNLILTKAEFDSGWQIPFGQSWLQRFA